MSFTTADRAVLQISFKTELEHILNYWATYAVDAAGGGFYGELNNQNQQVPGALKGSVLNARILWSFSAAYNLTKGSSYLPVAKRALNYIRDHFIDAEYGGVYWSVTPDGKPADTKKQIYALAFTIYGLAEYYKATHDKEALLLAQSLYDAIETHSFDKDKGGYLESFTRDWAMPDDMRLSDKDANEKKTMNTHLHILEAYTALYRVWPDDELEKQLRGLVANFISHIIDAKNHHLLLFFDEDWQSKSDMISYGHDIEASWLLLEAAEVLHDRQLIDQVKQLAVKIARASTEGCNADGSLNYEYEPAANYLIAEKHWWVQAEALVGFYNAWQISGEATFLNKVLTGWDYLQKNIIDHEKGEWFWGMGADGKLMDGYGKAGLWKCPYHNSRACMEMMIRLE